MADVINRVTLEHRQSVGAGYPAVDWKRLSLAEAQLARANPDNLKLTGAYVPGTSEQTLEVMTAPDRAARRAVRLAAAKALKVAELEEEKRYALEIRALAQMTAPQIRAAVDADIATVNAETDLGQVRRFQCTLLRRRLTER